MKIALDLEGTLIAECGEFVCERTSFLAQLIMPNPIRYGARTLLRDLVRAGHSLTLYSSGQHHSAQLWLWCRLNRLPVARIITLAQSRSSTKKLAKRRLQWPPIIGMDLVGDDDPRHLVAARQAGVSTVLITNCTPDWTACVREATLQSDSFEVVRTSLKPVKPVKLALASQMALFLILLILSVFPQSALAQRFSLGTAQHFAVLGGSTVTNTGPSQVLGDLGVGPGSAVTGFPPGIVTGSIHLADAVAALAQNDLTTSYNVLASLPPTQILTGQDLGGLTLTPGIYKFESSAQLTGALTLDALGDANALFVFQIGSSLTTASASQVILINGGDDCNVFWQAGASATLGTTTQFLGNILADQSITLNTGANMQEGRALARNAAVTLDTNLLSIADCTYLTEAAGTFAGTVAAPEPSSGVLILSLGLSLMKCRRAH